jgi:acyl carrier protein phosphodiesterase
LFEKVERGAYRLLAYPDRPEVADTRLTFLSEEGQHAYRRVLDLLKDHDLSSKWAKLSREEKMTKLVSSKSLSEEFERTARFYQSIGDMELGEMAV